MRMRTYVFSWYILANTHTVDMKKSGKDFAVPLCQRKKKITHEQTQAEDQRPRAAASPDACSKSKLGPGTPETKCQRPSLSPPHPQNQCCPKLPKGNLTLPRPLGNIDFGGVGGVSEPELLPNFLLSPVVLLHDMVQGQCMVSICYNIIGMVRRTSKYVSVFALL